MLVHDVIEENRKVLYQISSLSNRPTRGYNPICLPTSEELEKFFTERLAGKSCLAEVTDDGSLVWPLPDATLVAKVTAECPDALEVMGVTHKITYEDYIPRIFVSVQEGVHTWVVLPDAGLFLPNGHPVTIEAVNGFNRYNNTDLRLVKQWIRNQLNQGQWNGWRNRPEMTVPALSEEFPEVQEHPYGVCSLTQQPLIAYGTLTITYYSELATKWYQNRTEAEEAHQKGSEWFNALKQNASTMTESQRLEHEVRRLKAELRRVHATCPGELVSAANTLERLVQAYLYTDTQKQDWIARANNALEMVAETVARHEEKKIATGQLKEEKAVVETAKRELALVADALGGNEAIARQAITFAKSLRAIGEYKELVLEVLEEMQSQWTSWHSLDNKRAELENEFPGIRDKEMGSYVYSLRSEETFDAIIQGVIVWLKL